MNRVRRYILGCDLGQAQDPTALALLERVPKADEGSAVRTAEYTGSQRTLDLYHLRALERYRLGTPYTEVVNDLIARLIEVRRSSRGCLAQLVVDGTGVGRPVRDMLREAMKHTPALASARLAVVIFTGGNEVTRNGLTFGVPKRDLVSTLDVLLQSGRLLIAEGIPAREEFLTELMNVHRQIHVSTGRDAYVPWRESVHDDLVFSVAIHFGVEETASVELIGFGTDGEVQIYDRRSLTLGQSASLRVRVVGPAGTGMVVLCGLTSAGRVITAHCGYSIAD